MVKAPAASRASYSLKKAFIDSVKKGRMELISIMLRLFILMAAESLA